MVRYVEKSISGVFSQRDTPYIAHVNHDESYHRKHAQHTGHRTKKHTPDLSKNRSYIIGMKCHKLVDI